MEKSDSQPPALPGDPAEHEPAGGDAPAESDPSDDLDDEAFARELERDAGLGPSENLEDPDEEAPEPVAPGVVAVVVTSDGAGLVGTLSSLVAQDYPALSILVVDSGSSDDPTPRIASVAPRAFVRRLAENVGFAAAANEALVAVEGAAFLLFCHDDVVVDPSAVRVMVEEAYRSNAGVVGPKMVDRDLPGALLEVGLSVDHYGVIFSGIEPGEIDQEQHDAVRDVFFVSSATMLVRADLFAGLGGFDPETYPGSDDVDLCWRARLAGARVLVAPDARVGHARSGIGADRDAALGGERRLSRNRIRVLLKSYSGVALVWVLPTAFLLSVVEAVALAGTRRWASSRAVLGGWWANMREMGSVLRSRKETQALRTVGDVDVRELMVHGSARVRTYLAVRLHAGDRISEVSTRTMAAVDQARRRLTRPEAIAGLSLLALLLFGARSLIAGDVPAVGTFSRWPGLGPLLGAYWDPWRHTGLGTQAAAPPAFALMGVLTTVLLGDASLARTIVVAGALPLGAIGCYRAVRRLSASAWPAVAAAAAYGANPLPRNAIARGRLGPLVLYVLAPMLLATILRFVDEPGARGLGASPLGRRRAVLGTALIVAIATAVWPPAILVAPLFALGLVVAVPLVGGARIAGRALAIGVAAPAICAVLLAPWTFGVFGADPATFGFMQRSPIALADALRFHTGPAGAGWAPWGLYLAAALPLLVATGPRLAWAGRAWAIVAVSMSLAWVPTRLDAGLLVPVPDGALVGAALGLAVAVGLGTAALVDDLRQFHFGWRQVAALVAAFGLCLPILGLLPDTLGGRYRMPGRDWGGALAWMEEEQSDGMFRVLWLGDPAVLPLDAREASGIGYGMTVNGLGDIRMLQPAKGNADPVIEEAIGLLAAGRTARAGHLIAPMGIRYVALVSRGGPGSGAQAAVDERFARALGGQLDLAVLESERGMLLYENRMWAPMRSVVPQSRAGLVPVDSTDPVADSARTAIDDAKPMSGAFGDGDPAGPGLLLWSEAYDDRWRAESGGRPLEHVRALGLTNGFIVPERERIGLTYERDLTRPALLAAQAAAWLLVCFAWWRSRRGADASRSSDDAQTEGPTT